MTEIKIHDPFSAMAAGPVMTGSALPRYPDDIRNRRPELAAVAERYWKAMAPRGPVPVIDEAFLDMIRRERHMSRQENSGGGCCHLVTEILQATHGLEKCAVSVLAPDGRVAMSGHYISLMPNGSILDPTADQFGTRSDILLLSPSDGDYGLYRPEFSDEWNPDHEPELAGWSEFPGAEHGWDDFDQDNALKADMGPHWWCRDPSRQLAWLENTSRTYGSWSLARHDELEPDFAG
ncbi:hypothetical protein [Paracoccus sp. ME4]|uniref:hypothetical protein n=1 Tax=Paracoccus sp. ME4 TaxID=3138066 RepID=UPI00398A8AB4